MTSSQYEVRVSEEKLQPHPTTWVYMEVTEHRLAEFFWLANASLTTSERGVHRVRYLNECTGVRGLGSSDREDTVERE